MLFQAIVEAKMHKSTDIPMASRTAKSFTIRGRDKHIMATNDSSIVSKCSVEAQYYPEPHFYRYFVEKPKRRAPLVSRGYWLRMRCVETILDRFLRRNDQYPKVVVNLGAGYDTLPFRSMTKSPKDGCLHVEIDYADVIRNKVALLNAAPEVVQLCRNRRQDMEVGEVHFYSDNYIALACDLRNLEAFSATLTKVIPFFWTSPVLWISEVSTCYMDTDVADRLIEWAGRHKTSTFCILEQQLPQGREYPFADQMLQHFDRLKSPLQAVRDYPNLEHQRKRFIERGWTTVHAKSLFDIWNATGEHEFVSMQDRGGLNDSESFDEWEEFALYTCHYFLLVATNGDSKSAVALLPDSSTRPWTRVTIPIMPEVRIKTGASPLDRRFGALWFHSDGNCCLHGGMGSTGRESSSINVPIVTQNTSISTSSSPMMPRMCHTITPLTEKSSYLLVGGRSSPTKAFSDCWLYENGEWNGVEDLPTALYRHAATAVSLTNGRIGVLVYGGRTSDGNASSACYLWTPETKELGLESKCWQVVSTFGTQPAFAAVICSANLSTRGILLGGLTSEGLNAGNFYTWQLCRADEQWELKTRRLDGLAERYVHLARFGATLTDHGTFWVLAGGIQQDGIPDREGEILLLDHKVIDDRDGASMHFVSPSAGTGRRLLLVGHAAAAHNGITALVGGGATCFGFGSRRNDAFVVLGSGN